MCRSTPVAGFSRRYSQAFIAVRASIPDQSSNRPRQSLGWPANNSSGKVLSEVPNRSRVSRWASSSTPAGQCSSRPLTRSRRSCGQPLASRVPTVPLRVRDSSRAKPSRRARNALGNPCQLASSDSCVTAGNCVNASATAGICPCSILSSRLRTAPKRLTRPPSGSLSNRSALSFKVLTWEKSASSTGKSPAALKSNPRSR